MALTATPESGLASPGLYPGLDVYPDADLYPAGVLLSGQPPRVALTVDTTGATVTLTRTNPDGTVYPVRSADTVTLTGGMWAGYDYEAPFGVPVIYTATTEGGLVSVSAPVTLNPYPLRPWLIYPGVPAASFTFTISSVGDVGREIDRGVHHPVGRRTAVVISDRRQGVDTSIVIYTATAGARDAVTTITDLGAVLLLNVPPGLGYDLPWMYISVGAVSEARAVPRILTDPARLITLPYTEVDPPAGLSAQAYTWGDVLLEIPTWQALPAAFTDWTSVLAAVEYV